MIKFLRRLTRVGTNFVSLNESIRRCSASSHFREITLHLAVAIADFLHLFFVYYLVASINLNYLETFIMSHRLEVLTDIYNGAKCKSYRWSQSYSDLEIRIKLKQVVKYENVDVSIDSSKIRVTIDGRKLSKSQRTIKDSGSSSNETKTSDILIEGNFRHSVDTESAYWLVDNEEPCIVIYIDKAEDLWWKELLVNEEVTEAGPINYTVSMDHMDDGSRMVIDKLIVEQRNKLASRSNRYPDLS